MAKNTPKIVFLCSSCGMDFPKWFGQCPSCNEWGTLSEFKTVGTGSNPLASRSKNPRPIQAITDTATSVRQKTKISEVDRVLGGGLLPGSVILLGGNPGIGKSTLALQLLANIPGKTLYVSAEESEEQIALRAKRLHINSQNMSLSGENRITAIIDSVEKEKINVLVVDSIQTVYSETSDSLPGSISQIRECAQQLLQFGKQNGITVIIIGHVTKEGIIAGPKMLEHMVDTVLYLEGDQKYDYRILRSVKNRFGATHEVGIFTMDEEGLQEVENPSEMFLSERSRGIAGTAVYPSLEGTRPIMIEVQALVSPANFGTPQRNVNGMDYRRLSMLLAVLEKRMSLAMGMRDVFVNLVGGLRVDDPAMDLAVLIAVASSALDKPLPDDCVFLGEVGLAGEVRSVHHIDQRLREAQALGFKRAIVPSTTKKKMDDYKLELTTVRYVRDVFKSVLG